MKKTIALLACAALAGFAFLSGCHDFNTNGDQPVQIRAVAKGSPTTKTAYGDTVTNGSTRWQIIHWVQNDKICIYSDKAVHRYFTDAVTNEPLHYADYVITGTPETDGHQSKARLKPDKNGLVWGDNDASDEKYAFWGIYPSASSFDADDPGKIEFIPADNPAAAPTVNATLPDAMQLSGSPNTKNLYFDESGNALSTATGAKTVYSYSVYEPEMKYAFMTAAVANVQSGANFDLPFDPAYTAFEINLTSADEDFSVTRIELAAAEDNTTDKLAGAFTMTAGNLATVAPADDASSSVAITSPTADGLPLTVTTSSGVTTYTGFTCTLFAMPKTNSGLLQLIITTKVAGNSNPVVATLDLTGSNDAAYQFQAGRKYRINMLKLGNRWKYYITLTPNVRPWDLQARETSFADQIQANAFKIESGAIEDWNEYVSNDPELDRTVYDPENPLIIINEDHKYILQDGFAEFLEQHPGYNYRLFQKRTLNTGAGIANPFFEVTFKPIAPLGGYWMLEKAGDSDYFRVVVWDENEEADNPNYTGSTDLRGQIMDSQVTLRIYANPSYSALDKSRSYALYFHATFATDSGFENSFNVDTEIQDAHKDGTFSYWYFVIPATV